MKQKLCIVNVCRVNVDALPTALCYGISRGGGNDWITAYEQYQRRRTSNFNDERYAYLFGMACTNDISYINMLVEEFIYRFIKLDGAAAIYLLADTTSHKTISS
jgi:hypothetical protein